MKILPIEARPLPFEQLADGLRQCLTARPDVREVHELGVPVELLVYTPAEFAAMCDEERPFIMEVVENGVRVL